MSQAVRDAMADAETLRVNAGVSDYSVEWKCWVGSPTTFRLNEAVMNADMAVRGALDFAAERGQIAARAAFRAVPGLRG